MEKFIANSTPETENIFTCVYDFFVMSYAMNLNRVLEFSMLNFDRNCAFMCGFGKQLDTLYNLNLFKSKKCGLQEMPMIISLFTPPNADPHL